jgi:hypothetical protein
MSKKLRHVSHQDLGALCWFDHRILVSIDLSIHHMLLDDYLAIECCYVWRGDGSEEDTACIDLLLL